MNRHNAKKTRRRSRREKIEVIEKAGYKIETVSVIDE